MDKLSMLVLYATQSSWNHIQVQKFDVKKIREILASAHLKARIEEIDDPDTRIRYSEQDSQESTALIE